MKFHKSHNQYWGQLLDFFFSRNREIRLDEWKKYVLWCVPFQAFTRFNTYSSIVNIIDKTFLRGKLLFKNYIIHKCEIGYKGQISNWHIFTAVNRLLLKVDENVFESDENPF